MGRRIIRQISLWLVALVILGCVPVSVTTPPTIAPGAVETIVVQTAAVAQTQTAILLPPTGTPTLTPLPTKTATITPTPTATVLFLFLTEISLPEFVDDPSAGNGGTDGAGSGGEDVKPRVVREWDCRVISRSPARGAAIFRGSSFKAIWTIENTGTKTWPKKGVDVVFYTGARIHDKPYYDIPATVGRGGTVRIEITLSAPKAVDTYTTHWSLKVGQHFFCPLNLTFETK